jgi:predicted SprT family Zn-dependent metalloprotease
MEKVHLFLFQLQKYTYHHGSSFFLFIKQIFYYSDCKTNKNNYTGKTNYCHLEQHQYDLLRMAQMDVMYLSVVCTSLLGLVDLF